MLSEQKAVFALFSTECRKKTHPQQGPTLQGLNLGDISPAWRPAVRGSATPSGSGNERRAFRGRCPATILCFFRSSTSGQVQGTKSLPFGLTPRGTPF